jgi:hypothetical protein
MRSIRLAVTLAALVLASGCVKQYLPGEKDKTQSEVTSTSPTPVPVPVVHTIEYRVLGTSDQATIWYGNAIDGDTETVSILPWSAMVKTTRPSVFVFLRANTFLVGKLTVSIFVDGELFRQATTDINLGGTEADASGTVTFD